MAELAAPFVSESIFAEAFVDLTVRRGRDASGRPVWNEEDPVGEKLYKGTMHIIDPFIPGSYKAGTRIAQAGRDKADKFGRTFNLKDEAFGIFGFRQQKADPDRAAPFIFSEFKDLRSKAQRTFTTDILRGGEVTAGEIIEQYIGSELRRFEIYKNYLELEENLGRKVDPTIFNALPYISEFINKNASKNINENLDINLDLPQSLFEQEPQTPAFVPPEVSKRNTSAGTTITGQGQKSTTNLDRATKKAIITDMTTTEAIAERQGTI